MNKLPDPNATKPEHMLPMPVDQAPPGANTERAERLAALDHRWQALPQNLRTPDQSIGRFTVGCGATHGVYERCDFGCTACYLGKRANQQPAMPFAEVADQLRNLRRFLGPGGNVQITSGEVTLLPVDHLIRILAYANALGLSPMVMTHGDRLLHEPDYLMQLVRDGGLRKISFHVDITQRGRKGWSSPDSERQLNQVRHQCNQLLQQVKQTTGVSMKAATTMTVNAQNLPQLLDVVPWYLAQGRRFRVLSFQPQAETGRTRANGGVDADAVWQQIERAVGQPLNPYPLRFGHPACNRMALILAIQTERGPTGRGTTRQGSAEQGPADRSDVLVIEAVRQNQPMDRRFMDSFLAHFAGVAMPGKSAWRVMRSALAVFMRHPSWFWRLPSYGLRRSWQERRHLPRILAALIRNRLSIRACAFVVHAFMSREELNTPEGQERLAACTFRLPVNGQMVSMCAMNATDLRESTYQV